MVNNIWEETVRMWRGISLMHLNIWLPHLLAAHRQGLQQGFSKRQPVGQIRPANQFCLALWSWLLEYKEIYRKSSERGVHWALKHIFFLTSFGPSWNIVENPLAYNVRSLWTDSWLEISISEASELIVK